MSTSQTKMSQDANIDNLLQTGFETIVQAFELKTTTYQATIKEQNNTISELQTKLKLLKEEMEILKQENAFYKKENEQLINTISVFIEKFENGKKVKNGFE